MTITIIGPVKNLKGEILKFPDLRYNLLLDLSAPPTCRDDIGFPIVECDSGGEFVITKPDNTGGLVSTATVAEQVSKIFSSSCSSLSPLKAVFILKLCYYSISCMVTHAAGV